MARVIELDGLPDGVAKAIAETVRNLKRGYRENGGATHEEFRKLTAEEADRALEEILDSLPPMPSLSDRALSRESMYALEDDAR